MQLGGLTNAATRMRSLTGFPFTNLIKCVEMLHQAGGTASGNCICTGGWRLYPCPHSTAVKHLYEDIYREREIGLCYSLKYGILFVNFDVGLFWCTKNVAIQFITPQIPTQWSLFKQPGDMDSLMTSLSLPPTTTTYKTYKLDLGK